MTPIKRSNMVRKPQCQNRKLSDRCRGYDGDFYGAKVVDENARQGDYAARFEVRNGDDPHWGGGERSEVSRTTAPASRRATNAAASSP